MINRAYLNLALAILFASLATKHPLNAGAMSVTIVAPSRSAGINPMTLWVQRSPQNMKRPPGVIFLHNVLANHLAICHYTPTKLLETNDLKEAIMKNNSAGVSANWGTFHPRSRPSEAELSTPEAYLLARAIRTQAANIIGIGVTAESRLTDVELDLTAELIAAEFGDELGQVFDVLNNQEAPGFLESFRQWACERRARQGGENIG